MVDRAPPFPFSLAYRRSGARRGGKDLNHLQPDPSGKAAAGRSQQREHNTQILKIQTTLPHTDLKISPQQADGGPSSDSGVNAPLTSSEPQHICPPIHHCHSPCPTRQRDGFSFCRLLPGLPGTRPSEKAKDWLGDSCEKGAA